MSKETGKLVEQILKEVPATRSSDKLLLVEYLQRKGAGLTLHQQGILRSVSMEGITRCRRKFQEQGKYPPTAQVGAERQFKSMSVQQSIPSTSPERVPGLIEENPKKPDQRSMFEP